MSKRLKIFFGHLTISVLIALLVMGFVFFVWYPSPLASAVGVTHIFLMLLGSVENYRELIKLAHS